MVHAAGIRLASAQLVGLGVDKLNDWTDAVEQFTKKLRRKFQRRRHRQGEFLVAAMVECIQRKLGVQYNYDFMEGEYDASDSRNLFIHGPLTGFGGTCNSLPVVYVAIARRLQYPISLAQTKDHAFCRWDGPGRESFCFDAAGKGFLAHKEERYRQWPHRITAREEERNGYIRAMSRREELAFFASNRGNCLMDNFDFVSAVEAYHWAHELEPDKQSINDTLGLAVYSTQIWQWMMKLPEEEKDMPLPMALERAANQLDGPDVETYRKEAVKNILRIIQNRRRRDYARRHADIVQQEFPEPPRSPDDV